MPRLLITTLAALCLMVSSALAGPILRVAVEDHYPPYSYEDETGQMAGFNVDIAGALAQVMGMECRIVSVPWNDLLPRLAKGDYDAIVACMAVKPDRLQYAEFTDYYLRSQTGFIGRKGTPDDTSPEALRGMTLVSQDDTAQLAYLQKTYGQTSHVKGYPTMGEAFEAVADGHADLCLTPLLAGLEFLKSDAGQGCDIIGPALASDQFRYSPAHIAVAKGNTALRDELNHALKTIRSNGEFATISRRYFPFSVY
jgi:ABC-type amino acid transport/signal transduction systems, periplasmic component/domain